MASEDAVRRPYTGSCHCGATRYIVFLTLPHAPQPADVGPRGLHGQRLYRCNCTLCHKAGLFHVRVHEPHADFLLLSPLDPLGAASSPPSSSPSSPPSSSSPSSALTAYRCATGRIAWLFCRVCGGRCFSFAGDGAVESIDLEKLGVTAETRARVGAETGEMDGLTKVWRPTKGFTEGAGKQAYLSVNAYSLDHGQEGLDLREWTDKKHVMYLEYLSDGPQEVRYERPYPGGAY